MKKQIGLLVGVLLVGCAQGGDPAASLYFPGSDTPDGGGSAPSGDGGSPLPGPVPGLPGSPAAPDAGTAQPSADGGVTRPGADAGPAGVDAGSTPPPGAGGGLVQGLSISEIAIFQGSKVTIAKSGAKAAPPYVPVVAGRPGLLRVYVSGTVPQPVNAELTLTSSTGTTKFTDANKVLSGASTDGSLTTTYNFDLPAGAVAKDTTYLVRLIDPAAAPSSSGGPAQYPTSGAPESMGATSDGADVTITIVPVLYDADGTGRRPDTTAAQMKIYTDFLYQTYPVSKLNVVVHADHHYSATITAGGSNSWSNVLDDILQLRQSDNVAANNYYYGIFQPVAPAANGDWQSTYCRSSCILGIAPLTTDPNDTSSRGGVGAGYSGLEMATTMAQEIGHACGIDHAPYPAAGQANAPQSPDPNYPYSGALIGKWGYGFTDHKLYNPSSSRDFMSYASSNIWVSDYVQGLFFTRFKTVNNAFAPQRDRLYRRIAVNGDGSLVVGKASVYHEPPMGIAHSVTFLDARGAPLKTANGAYFGLSNGAGGYVLVEESDVVYQAVRVGGPDVNAVVAVH
jgi:hypothetical protein